MINIKSKKIIEYYFFIGICAFFVCYPFILSWISFHSEAILKYFASDAFYYIAIANNSSWSPLFSFDGEYPTNGFHPFFQTYLKIITNLFLENNIESQLIFIYFNSLFLLLISSVLLSYTLINIGYSKVLTVISIVPGFFHILFSDLSQQGNFWYFNNGMESSFSIFFFSILMCFILNRNFLNINKSYIFKFILLSITITLIIFSRLDDIFLIIVIFAYYFFETNNKYEKKLTFILIVLPTVLIACYCLVNFAYAGTLLPSSGSSKFGTSLYYNMMSFLNLIIPAGEIFSSNNWSIWQKTSGRAIFIAAPLLLSIFHIIFYSQNKNNLKKRLFPKILFYLSFYVIIKSLYNFFFVWIFHQGYWYFPINIVIFNFIVLFYLNELIKNVNFKKLKFNIIRNKNFELVIKSIIFLLILLTVLIVFNSFKNYNTEKEIYALGLSKLRFFSILFYIIISLIFVSYLGFNLEKGKISFLYKKIFLIFFLFVISNSYINSKQFLSHDLKNKSFINNSIKINYDLSELEKKLDSKIKIISYDDGIIASYLDFNVMSGLGFALDAEANNQKNEGQLLDLAYKRGYKFITSLNYIADINVTKGTNVNKFLERRFWLSENEKKTITSNYFIKTKVLILN